MPKITRDQVRVPADVMPESREEYIDNYLKATRGTGRLMLFACDQKIEHLNKDFYGEGIDLALRSAVRACAASLLINAASSRNMPLIIPRLTTS